VTLDYLLGEFNGGCTTADGRREQSLMAAVLQEANAPAQGRGPNRNPSCSSKIARERTPLH